MSTVRHPNPQRGCSNPPTNYDERATLDATRGAPLEDFMRTIGESNQTTIPSASSSQLGHTTANELPIQSKTSSASGSVLPALPAEDPNLLEHVVRSPINEVSVCTSSLQPQVGHMYLQVPQNSLQQQPWDHGHHIDAFIQAFFNGHQPRSNAEIISALMSMPLIMLMSIPSTTLASMFARLLAKRTFIDWYSSTINPSDNRLVAATSRRQNPRPINHKRVPWNLGAKLQACFIIDIVPSFPLTELGLLFGHKRTSSYGVLKKKEKLLRLPLEYLERTNTRNMQEVLEGREAGPIKSGQDMASYIVATLRNDPLTTKLDDEEFKSFSEGLKKFLLPIAKVLTQRGKDHKAEKAPPTECLIAMFARYWIHDREAPSNQQFCNTCYWDCTC